MSQQLRSDLITLWMESPGGAPGLQAQAESLLERAAPAARPELAATSEALQLLHLARWYGEDADQRQRERVVARAMEIHRTGPERAGLLALAATFCAQRGEAGLVDREDQARQLEAVADRTDLSDLERYWCCQPLCGWLINRQQYERALILAQRARAIGQGASETASGSIALSARMNALISLVLLCSGATQEANELMLQLTQADEAQGVRQLAVQYNLLLGLMLEGRADEALARVQQRPWLKDPERLSLLPTAAALLAWMHSGAGQIDEAARLLPLAGNPQQDSPTMTGGNQAWMRAETWLRMGRSREARASLDDFLLRQARAPLPPTPLNGTQLYRVLSLACEAEGDVAGALAALRQSQAMCMRWVADEVRSRLRLLTAEAGSESSQKLEQRCEAVRSAAAQSIEQQQQDEAAQAARLRQQLTVVVHELRNPLFGVVGATSLAMLGEMDDRQRRYLNIANSSARVLNSLCTNLLDLSRIEAGNFQLQPQRFELRPMIDESLSIFKPMADMQSLLLQHEWAATAPATVKLDRLRLQQVLMNLIGNALKFTRQGSVTVRVAGITGGLRIEVLDTGPGLQPAVLERVFDEFYTNAAGADEPQVVGWGVGLALCRQLVTLMGGQIGVLSQPGRGSRFWLELPLGTGAEDHPRASTDAAANAPPLSALY